MRASEEGVGPSACAESDSGAELPALDSLRGYNCSCGPPMSAFSISVSSSVKWGSLLSGLSQWIILLIIISNEYI